jgi:hypothetical protein
VVLHEVHAVHALVEGGEADLDGAGVELAGEGLEDGLRVEVAPDGRLVEVGRIGVLAADDDVREAVVLTASEGPP